MFSKDNRLNNNRDIQRVVRFGKQFVSPHFKVYWQKRKDTNLQDNQPTLVTVIVGKKVAKGAVDRNRIKRRLRAAVKSLEMPKNLEVVFFPNNQVRTIPFDVLTEDLEKWIAKVN